MENYLKYQQANNQITSGIFLDLKKAFDTVDHNILKKKLKIKGIRGLSYDLISSYLANRYQFTSVNSQKSDKNIIDYGFPQGSTLGPILFLLYINDLPKSSNLNSNSRNCSCASLKISPISHCTTCFSNIGEFYFLKFFFKSDK